MSLIIETIFNFEGMYCKMYPIHYEIEVTT